MDVINGSHNVNGDVWVGIFVPLALILFGILLPYVGGLLSRGGERYILQYVQETLVSRIEKTPVSLNTLRL
jgi:hypothetical protein